LSLVRMASGWPPGFGWGMPTQPSGLALIKKRRCRLCWGLAGSGQGVGKVALMLVRVCRCLEELLREGEPPSTAGTCLMSCPCGWFGLAHPALWAGRCVPCPHLRAAAAASGACVGLKASFWTSRTSRPSRYRDKPTVRQGSGGHSATAVFQRRVAPRAFGALITCTPGAVTSTPVWVPPARVITTVDA
jgi:hypothetical protein